jgi:hypothetical protein
MTQARPEAGCYDIGFEAPFPLDEEAEVALEDYARVLTRSTRAEAVRAEDDPSSVRGVHVCGLGAAVTSAVLRDLHDFARSMVTGPGGGLGWS